MLWGGMRGDSLRVLRHCDFYVRLYRNIGGARGAWGLCWLQDEGKTNAARPQILFACLSHRSPSS